MVKRVVLLGCVVSFLTLTGIAGADDQAGQKPAGGERIQKALENKPGIGAPTKEAPKDWVAERANSLKEKLGLSDEQTEKVKEILASQREQMKALKSDTTLTEEQRKEKAREIEKAALDAISAILTPEQKAKWEEMKKSEQKGKEKKAGGDGAPGKEKPRGNAGGAK